MCEDITCTRESGCLTSARRLTPFENQETPTIDFQWLSLKRTLFALWDCSESQHNPYPIPGSLICARHILKTINDTFVITIRLEQLGQRSLWVVWLTSLQTHSWTDSAATPQPTAAEAVVLLQQKNHTLIRVIRCVLFGAGATRSGFSFIQASQVHYVVLKQGLAYHPRGPIRHIWLQL